MNEDRITGTARNLGGKLEEGVGRVTGDIKEQVQGKLDQAAGAAQDLYGQTTDVARDTAVTFEKWLRSSPGGHRLGFSIRPVRKPGSDQRTACASQWNPSRQRCRNPARANRPADRK